MLGISTRLADPNAGSQEYCASTRDEEGTEKLCLVHEVSLIRMIL